MKILVPLLGAMLIFLAGGSVGYSLADRAQPDPHFECPFPQSVDQIQEAPVIPVIYEHDVKG
jgi:hypothetical protein